jgi:hypothetical protein
MACAPTTESVQSLYRSVLNERRDRRDGDENLRRRIDSPNEAIRGELTDLRRLLDEVSRPERVEWAGLGLLVVGSVLAFAP